VNQRFAILNPCSKRWVDLEGKGRVRFCESCQTHVHAVAEYSVGEWEQVEKKATGRVCILLCGETLAAPRSRRAVLIGALLTAVAPLWAQTGSVRIRVTDITGGGVPKAQVSLVDANEKPTRTAEANNIGEVVWTDLPLGDAHFLVSEPGFNSLRLVVTIRNANEQTVDARLAVGEERGLLEVQPVRVPPPQTLDSPSLQAPISRPAKRKWWQIFR
jgi:hypothetical protein